MKVSLESHDKKTEITLDDGVALYDFIDDAIIPLLVSAGYTVGAINDCLKQANIYIDKKS